MARIQKKSPVQLRTKKLKNGSESLYLDIYYNGKRTYEYLSLYLNPERTEDDKKENRMTIQLAEKIRSVRSIELSQMIADDGDDNVVDRMRTSNKTVLQFVDEQGKSKSYIQFINFFKPEFSKMKIIEFNKKFLMKKLVKVLDEKNITNTTRFTIFIIARAIYNKAVECGYVKNEIVKNPYKCDTKDRKYLTREEITMFKAVETKTESEKEIKNAFLFSCFTGLRISDIKDLRWKDISHFDKYVRITFSQKKTKKQEYYDISPVAEQYMCERKDDSDNVYQLSPYDINPQLRRLVERAGINKHISFHCARHTFAVLMLDLGVDLYTTSKLLGHTQISTTQIYAKVLDKNKQKAVDLIPDL